MSVRELIHEKQTFGVAAATVILLVAASLIGWQLFGVRPHPGHHAFYSDDDGKTWFVDEADKPSPFDHNGMPAYRVAVFRRNGSELFVAYLMRDSDFKPPMPRGLVDDPQATNPRFRPRLAMDIKKPGAARWLSINGGLRPSRDEPLTGKAASDEAAYNNLLYPTIPPGQTVRPVTPDDPDNGAQPR